MEINLHARAVVGVPTWLPPDSSHCGDVRYDVRQALVLVIKLIVTQPDPCFEQPPRPLCFFT